MLCMIAAESNLNPFPEPVSIYMNSSLVSNEKQKQKSIISVTF